MVRKLNGMICQHLLEKCKLKFSFQIVLSSVFILTLSSFALTNKIVVDKNTSSNSIKEAIALANPYDEIIIKKGFYSEGNIIIDKPLRIIGNEFPILDGGNKEEIFTVISDSVFISGIIFKNAGVSYLKENAAVRIENVKSCSVIDCKFYGNFFGVYIAASNDCLIKNNFIKSYGKSETSSGNGIHLWNCSKIIISNNEISGHRDGIYLEFVKDALIEKNHSKNNLRYGLHFMFSDGCTYAENKFEYNGAGVAVMYTKNVIMKNNSFNNNWGPASYGLLLKDISESRIDKNMFLENTTGVYLEGCSKSTFENNVFDKNGWAIKLMANSTNNTFSQNDFLSNTFDLSTNSQQNFNTFNKNYYSKYTGYDLDKNGIGDVPYRPVKLYSIMVEQQKPALVLINSLFIELLDIAESVFPSLTPETLVDEQPILRKIN